MKKFISVFLMVVVCIISVPTIAYAQRDISKEEVLAQELKELGLFRGVSEIDFDLDRAPSRVEALVMLIRVLGKENEVMTDTWKHPFTDVPGWADNYVGYAYSKGLTNGQSATQFGTGDANAAMYLTFVLRALGYSDTSGKDFSWDNPYTLARETGILDDDVNINEFWRADVVLVSHAALSSYLKGSQNTLAQKLILAGVFSQNEFNSVYYKGANVTPSTTKDELTAEEIFAKCSSSVFFVVNYDRNNQPVSTGSGFFIDDKGTAVTNYHVIADAYFALVQLSDTEEVYEVLGVYDYSVEEDWAVIKIDCSGNDYLTIDSTYAVTGGSKVYAIGSPLGLQNTISEGIVSNPARVVGEKTFIQTNAAFSHGSSGGALLNKKGDVIGITSAIIEYGQNLNFALPISYVQGYNSSELKSLDSLYNTNSGVLSDAYKLLYNWVKENGTDAGDGIVCEYDYDDVKYSVEYNYDYDNVFITCIGYYEEYNYSSIIYLDSLFYGCFLDDMSLYGYLPKEPLNKDEPLPYLEYVGPDSAKDTIIDFSKAQISDSLDWFELFLDYNNIDISIYDMGIPSIEYDWQPYEEDVGISYILSSDSVQLNVEETTYISFDYTENGFPEDTIFTIELEDESVATAVWDDMEDFELPWDIRITGVSPGSTKLTISNDFNNQTISIPIYVDIDNSAKNTSYNYLKAWMYENGETNGSRKVISTTFDDLKINNADGYFVVEYDANTNKIYFSVIVEVSDTKIRQGIVVLENNTNYIHGYTTYENTASGEITHNISGIINAPYYTIDGPLAYLTYDGPKNHETEFSEISRLVISATITCFSNFLILYPEMDISDFGFKSIK